MIRNFEPALGGNVTQLPHGYFFEEFSVGQSFSTESRTITTEDVKYFISICGDSNPIHTNKHTMESHPLKKPVIHGMLATSIGVGLISKLGLTTDTLIAMLEQKIVYKSPVYVGDTIHGKVEVIETRKTSNPKRGIIMYRFKIYTSTNLVIEGKNTLMVFSKNTHG